jgi:hypothetical protein
VASTRQPDHKLEVVLARLRFALFLGLCGGLAAVLLDIDHIALVWGYPVGRALHTPALILAGGVAVYCCARLGRLLPGLFLRNFLAMLFISVFTVAISFGLAYLMGEFFWGRIVGLYD